MYGIISNTRSPRHPDRRARRRRAPRRHNHRSRLRAAPLEAEGRTLAADREPIYALVEALVVPALGAWFRWTVEGTGNIPARGPAILACNHISYLDPLALGYVVDRAGRRPRFLAKSELFRDRRIGWILRATRQIEVRRGTSRAASALEDAFDALARGEVVVIFPEGTVTTHPDLEPMAAKSGAVRLALRARAPVVPCAVWGTANVWPKGPYERRWHPRQDLLVRIGSPMTVEGSVDRVEDVRVAGERIMSEIATLVASLKPVVPDTRRPRASVAARDGLPPERMGMR